jgi:hypothetical protein
MSTFTSEKSLLVRSFVEGAVRDFENTIQLLADQYRSSCLIPFCKKYGVEFIREANEYQFCGSRPPFLFRVKPESIDIPDYQEICAVLNLEISALGLPPVAFLTFFDSVKAEHL